MNWLRPVGRIWTRLCLFHRIWAWLDPQSPISRTLRIKFFLTGIVFPLTGLLFLLGGMPVMLDSPWQSGESRDYIAVLMRYPALVLFFPCVGFSMICLGTWTIAPKTSRFFVLRLGIYTGVAVGLLLFVLIYMTTSILTLIAAAIVGVALAVVTFSIAKIIKHARRFTIRHLLILTGGCAVVIFLVQLLDLGENVGASFVIAFLLILFSAPTLGLLTYVRATRIVSRESQWIRLAGLHWLKIVGYLVAGGTWVTTAVVCYRYAVVLMLHEYSKLPTTDPNCYLSSGARHGHPWLVGARTSVGPQTKRLKFLELVFAQGCPRLHSRVRVCYDLIGPPLARYCGRNRWFADATYVALMPLAWLADCLRIVLRIPKSTILAMYLGQD